MTSVFSCIIAISDLDLNVPRLRSLSYICMFLPVRYASCTRRPSPLWHGLRNSTYSSSFVDRSEVLTLPRVLLFVLPPLFRQSLCA
jgi:hypothetical protein